MKGMRCYFFVLMVSLSVYKPAQAMDMISGLHILSVVLAAVAGGLTAGELKDLEDRELKRNTIACAVSGAMIGVLLEALPLPRKELYTIVVGAAYIGTFMQTIFFRRREG